MAGVLGVGCDTFLKLQYLSIVNMRASENKRGRGGSDDGWRDKLLSAHRRIALCPVLERPTMTTAQRQRKGR
jgi:hypothetical protein